METFFSQLESLITALPTLAVFFVVALLQILSTIILCVLSRFAEKKNKTARYLTANFCVCGFFLFVVVSHAIIGKTDFSIVFYCLLELAVCFLSFVPFCLKSKTKIGVENSKKDFVETVCRAQTEKPLSIIRALPKQNEENKTDLNFSHVKNVIKRLSVLPLSPCDKKTVNDLYDKILLCERGGLNGENKLDINDGLGMLLKIMAKHNV